MDKKTFVIAEIGVNHGNDMGLARDLILSARDAGADAVKFQTFIGERLATERTPKAPYQAVRDSDRSHREMLSSLELKKADHVELFDFCNLHGIEFISTAYSLEDARFLAGLGLNKIKVASADIVDTRLLSYLSELEIVAILSTGMASVPEIERALDIFSDSKSAVWLLHCISEYPTRPSRAHLSRIRQLRKLHSGVIGYSDHTLGSEAARLSIGVGATVVEKHLTYDNSAVGPDHYASANIEQFKELVEAIRQSEILLGSEQFDRSLDEQAMALTSRKSLHYERNLSVGDVLTEECIKLARPGDGLFWDERNRVLNKKLKVQVMADQLVNPSDLI